MKHVQILKAALFVCASLAAPAAFGQAALVGDVMYSGGLTLPQAPQSQGVSVYADGHVVTYKNYADHSEVVTVAFLTGPQISKLLAAAAALAPADLVRDTTQPACADAPYEQVAIVNSAGVMVKVKDNMGCIPGHRADWAAFTDGGLLESLAAVAEYGSR